MPRHRSPRPVAIPPIDSTSHRVGDPSNIRPTLPGVEPAPSSRFVTAGSTGRAADRRTTRERAWCSRARAGAATTFRVARDGVSPCGAGRPVMTYDPYADPDRQRVTVERTTTTPVDPVVHDHVTTVHTSPIDTIRRLVYLLFGVLQALLVLRIVLLLLNANEGN